jgi:hypothetical protein
VFGYPRVRSLNNDSTDAAPSIADVKQGEIEPRKISLVRACPPMNR